MDNRSKSLGIKLSTTKFKRIKKFLTKEKEPNYRFDQITKAIFQDKVGDFKKITTLPKELRKKLVKKFGHLLSIKAKLGV